MAGGAAAGAVLAIAFGAATVVPDVLNRDRARPASQTHADRPWVHDPRGGDALADRPAAERTRIRAFKSAMADALSDSMGSRLGVDLVEAYPDDVGSYRAWRGSTALPVFLRVAVLAGQSPPDVCSVDYVKRAGCALPVLHMSGASMGGENLETKRCQAQVRILFASTLVQVTVEADEVGANLPFSSVALHDAFTDFDPVMRLLRKVEEAPLEPAWDGQAPTPLLQPGSAGPLPVCQGG
ncbi:hypothetical protein [Embleya sp. NBC_00896]|uniref:hypothetical protein n=1 Tax=Embleya sp. NBC_00896 TaxID=2975961 RepID=UPI003868D13A|nr:hypothetical protein OG928_01890 [Embleya sp. NBC_00896]